MENRACITTNDKRMGVYLHWNGGRDSVEAFLKYCELQGYRAPSDDCYGWARLCQVIGNFFGGGLSVGIDTYDRMDTDNGDNGVYIIEGWKIVDREFMSYEEQSSYDLTEMLLSIDSCMPEKERLGAGYITAEEVDSSELNIGDVVYIRTHGGGMKHLRVVAFGDDMTVNGTNVLGVPMVILYGTEIGDAKYNINNYLRGAFRAIRKSNLGMSA